MDNSHDEAAAYELLEHLRWGGVPTRCPHCQVAGRCYFLHPRRGRPRQTRTGNPTPRRIWKCGSCRAQFSVLTGTVFEGTRISVLQWVHLVADLADGRAVHELRRRDAMTGRTLRTMIRRLALCDEYVPELRRLSDAATVVDRGR